ncbi:MAG: hypothetical protein JRN12_08280, partial [Nitrososphaerota archaeon]|nr:hypothetical protein [Nitrososphaerota archaeon]
MSVGKQALKYTAAAIAVAAIIIVSSTLYLGVNLGATTTTGASGAQGGTPAQLAIQLTDPPTVPTGVTGVYITYSNLAVHAAGFGNSGWISVPGHGTFDSMKDR